MISLLIRWHIQSSKENTSDDLQTYTDYIHTLAEVAHYYFDDSRKRNWTLDFKELLERDYRI